MKALSPKTPNGQYNVQSFGAKGDGSTDDILALNAALQAAYDAGGGVVRVPPGSYKTTDPMVIRQNTSLICDNGVTFLRYAAGALIQNGDYGEDQSAYTGHGNIIIRGGTWNMRGVSVTDANLCFAIAHGLNIRIEDVTIQDVPTNHAIEINSSKNVRIKNCRFLGMYLGAGDASLMECVQIDLAIAGTFGAFGLEDSTHCEDIIVEGCYFGASGTASTQVWPRGVGSHSSSSTSGHAGITVRDCTFDGMSGTAVPGRWNRVNILNNKFLACGAGIYMNTTTNEELHNINIIGNTFLNMGNSAACISIAPNTANNGLVSGVNIIGNNIESSTSGANAKGILIGGTTRAVISDNIVVGTGNIGIYISDGSDKITCTGNTLQAIGDTGIYCDSSNDVIISDNNIRTTQANGIHVVGGADISIKDNMMRAVGRAANATYFGIRLSTSVAGYSIANNRIRKNGSGNEPSKGISVTSSCTGGSMVRNDIQDTGYDDQGTTPATSTGSPKGATVVTSETTTSNSYVNLTTSGPAVTLDTGTSVIITLGANASNATAGSFASMSVAVSGATTIAADDAVAFIYRAAANNYQMQGSNTFILTGLTPGSNTFTAKYSNITGSNAAAFSRRSIIVTPINM